MIRNKIRAVFHPEQFQGWTRKRNYFEGWYFKVVNEDETKAFAFDVGIVELVMENKKFRLEMLVRREAATELASPILGLMDGRIEESMNALAEVNLIDRKSGKSIFNDAGRNAGLEVAGKIEEIIIP